MTTHSLGLLCCVAPVLRNKSDGVSSSSCVVLHQSVSDVGAIVKDSELDDKHLNFFEESIYCS